MALMHRCPNGQSTKLTRIGPVGTMEGVEFRCPSCGHSKSAVQIDRDYEALRPTFSGRLGRGRHVVTTLDED